MTGTTALQNYDNFVQNNYQRLYVHALVQTHNEEEAIDLLHDTYIKIKEYIIMSGYSGTGFITHFCTSIRNRFIDMKRKKQFVMVQADGLEDKEYENDSEETEEKMKENEYKCKYVFKYIENNYDERQCYVFKVYYLYPPNQRMTYAKISQQTGLGISYCSETIKTIREDLRLNLYKYIDSHGNNVDRTGNQGLKGINSHRSLQTTND